jgi:elongator complex protein 1
VTVITSTFAVILQMPRGNLETIYPRALVLAGIRRNIRKGEYRAAFLACRAQRVDMNILYDLDPQKFISSASEFVSQISRIDYLDLFLSALRSVSYLLLFLHS